MKRIAACAIIAAALLCACSGNAIIKTVPFSDNLDLDTLTVDSAEGIPLFDVSDKRLSVGFADYVFVATVKSLDEVVYVEHHSGADELRDVYTIISLQIEENIKGELKKDVPVKMSFHGGPDLKTKRLMLFGNDLPEPGSTYVFLACVRSDGEIGNIGVGGVYPIESLTDSLVSEFKDAYEHQDTTYYTDRGYKTRYDVNYKGE